MNALIFACHNTLFAKYTGFFIPSYYAIIVPFEGVCRAYIYAELITALGTYIGRKEKACFIPVDPYGGLEVKKVLSMIVHACDLT